MPLYKIVFTDNTTFLGGDTLQDNKWLLIPDKDILCLEFYLYNGSSLKLEGYESYAANIEVLQQLNRRIGNCPKCNKRAQLTKMAFKTANDTTKSKLMARCKDDKCKWVGKIQELKDGKNYSGKWFYIMGLKNGIVTSHRITLNGINGKDKYQTGDITTRDFPIGKEFKGKQGLPDTCWKKGIK